jgi:hypothetical protein
MEAGISSCNKQTSFFTPWLGRQSVSAAEALNTQAQIRRHCEITQLAWFGWALPMVDLE